MKVSLVAFAITTVIYQSQIPVRDNDTIFLYFGETQLLITFILLLLQKKKPVEVETTVIQGSGRDNGGNGNTRNRLTNLNSGNQNNTNNSETGNQSRDIVSQEMNDIQVRVINDNLNTISGPSGGNGNTGKTGKNWRHNESKIEVAMASPEEENLPPEVEPPSYLPPQVTTALVNETSSASLNNSSKAEAEALCDQKTETGNGNAAEELPQVKISNL